MVLSSGVLLQFHLLQSSPGLSLGTCAEEIKKSELIISPLSLCCPVRTATLHRPSPSAGLPSGLPAGRARFPSTNKPRDLVHCSGRSGSNSPFHRNIRTSSSRPPPDRYLPPGSSEEITWPMIWAEQGSRSPLSPLRKRKFLSKTFY